MRQLWIQVPRGRGQEVIDAAVRFEAVNLSRTEAESADRPIELVCAHVSNHNVGPLLDSLEAIPELRVSFAPQGVFALRPPVSEAPDQVTDVRSRSPIEVYLAGLQSIGSWHGFLSYAAISGVVVWIGLYTGTSYLLTAAMLIAPFAGPAMNAAIAAAAGNVHLLGRTVGRYAAALSVSIVVACLLSLLFQQRIATPQMVERSQVSVVAVLLPLTAGAAGALNLLQTERSSLVSGAAIGMLVAASLAPPAGLIGMAAAIGRWDLTTGGLFLLALQLAGIHLSGAVVFRLAGMSTGGARYESQWRGLFPTSIGIAAAVLGGLLFLQLSNPLALERASLSQRVTAKVQEVVEASQLATLVRAEASFTRPRIPGEEVVLCELYVLQEARDPKAIKAELSRDVAEAIEREWPFLRPLVNVTVFEKEMFGSP